MKTRYILSFFILILVFSSVVNVAAQCPSGSNVRLYVDSSKSSSGAGTSWSTAYKTLTEALDVANACSNVSEVWVAKGTYKPMSSATTVASSRDSSFRILRNGLKVYGGFAGNETTLGARNITAHLCALSGDIGTTNDSSDNVYHVMTIVGNSTSNIDTTTIVDGFTITRGRNNANGSFQVNGTSLSKANGGGILICGIGSGNNCSPLIENCVFTRNAGNYGCAIYFDANFSGNCSGIVRNCSFTANTGFNGAAMMLYGAVVNPKIVGCTFIGNRSLYNGGAIKNDGTGGIANASYQDCVFTDNATGSGTQNGGAIYISGTTTTISISNTSFNKNSSGGEGGAIFNQALKISLTQCSFSENSSSSNGGGIENYGLAVINQTSFLLNKSSSGAAISTNDSLEISNCTFKLDSATNTGAAIACTGGFADINACTFQNAWGAVTGVIDVNNSGAVLNVRNSIFANNKAGNTGGAGNIFFGTANFTNCVFSGNATTSSTIGSGGGALHVHFATLNLYNCTFNDNTTALTSSGNGNALGAENTSVLSINNSIVWGAAANQIQINGTPTLSYNYSDLKGITASGTNISSNPLFYNASDPDGIDNIWGTADDGLSLTSTSPVINAGANALIPSGITTDITGATRTQQTTVDMGAYEVLGSVCPSGSRLYVDSSKSSSGAGTSWATAFKTLSEALDVANTCTNISEVWVAKGTYKPMKSPTAVASSRDSSFRILRNGIKVYGGFAGNETTLAARNITANLSTLSGDIGTANDSTDNIYNVVTVFTSNATAADTAHVIVDGFTIRDGNGNDSYPGTTLIQPYNQAGGVLLRIESGNKTNADVSNCIFKSNFGVYGGAVCNYANGSGTMGNLSLYGCVFDANRGLLGGAVGEVGLSGGKGTSNIQNCVFYNNYSFGNTGGAIGSDGDGSGSQYTTTINNCTFYGNNSPVFFNLQQNTGTGSIAISNSIVWKSGSAYTSLTSGSNFTLNYNTLFLGSVSGTNSNTNPSFINPDNAIGADSIWATADDGLQLAPCSPSVNTGSNTYVPSSLSTDLLGTTRIKQSIVDRGAFETNSAASRIYVNGAVTSSGNGGSWASAFKTVTEALTLANNAPCVDTIWVKAGTYYPTTAAGVATTSRDSSFRILRNGIKIFGGFAGTETLFSQRNITTNITTLSGDIGTLNDSSDNAKHVFTIVGNSSNNIDTTTIVDGFTITRGRNNGGSTFNVNGTPIGGTDGGGMLLAGNGSGNKCSPLIQNCIFTRNAGNYGCGIYHAGYANGASSGIVRNCDFTANTASAGAAMALYGTIVNPLIENCNFIGNKASSGAGAIDNNGGGGNCSSTFKNCTFSNNAATNGGGGAIWVRGGTTIVTLSNATFSNNTASSNGGALRIDAGATVIVNQSAFNQNVVANAGGAIVNDGYSTISNSSFSGNTSITGGAIMSYNSLVLNSCTFSLDSASFSGAAIACSGGHVNVDSCKFLNERGTVTGALDINLGVAVFNIRNSVFANNRCQNTGGAGNIYAGTANFTNTVFSGNTTTTTGAGGGALHVDFGTINLYNCTFNDNTTASTTSPNGNAICAESSSTLSINNSIVWGSAANQIQINGTPTVSYNYSDLKSVTASGTNISADPLFYNASDPDGADNIWATADDGLAITICSPAINLGSNSLIPSGITTDITRAARIQNLTVDMGAYEGGTLTPRVYVDGAVATTGTGVSWASPYKTLTEALDFVNASPCVSEVWVKAGTYYPMSSLTTVATSRDSSFRIQRDGIKVYGGFAGTETSVGQRNIAANPTILSGDLGTANDSTDNVYHVFTILPLNGTATIDTTTRLDGLTIRDGNGYLAGGSFTSGGFGLNHQDGGGLYLGAYNGGTCSPQIVNCTFSHNAANYGGGCYVNGFTNAGANTRPSFTNCTFISNNANIQGGGVFNNGNNYNVKVLVTNCSFIGNNANGFGGGLYNVRSNVGFTADSFAKNTSGSGGAMYNNLDSLTYVNCRFRGNTTTGSGGAIFNLNSTGTCASSTFINDTAVIRSGAIYQNGKNWAYSDCSFIGNASTTSEGAAIYAIYDSSIYDNCSFIGNFAKGSAGAVYCNNDTATVVNCTFTSNIDSADCGGLVSVGASLLRLSNSSFTANSSVNGHGGALYVNGTSIVDNCTFQNNISLKGGAIANLGNGRTMTITKSVLSGNTSTSFGGGITNEFGANLVVDSSTFSGNVALSSNGGGALYTQNTAAVTFTNVTLTDNKSTVGGAVCNIGTSLYFSKCLFEGNRSSGNGGSIYLQSGTLYSTDNVYSKDTATNGACLYITSNSKLNADRNYFTNCVATNGGGGGIYSSNSIDTLTNNIFNGNKTTGGTGGGGLYLSMTTAKSSLIANNTFYNNSVSAGSGGAIRIVGSDGVLGLYNNVAWANGSNTLVEIVDNTSGTAVVSRSNNFYGRNPIFTIPSMPAGADGLWGNTDDGLHLQPCSPAIAYGINAPIAAYPLDAGNNTRIQRSIVEAGAYESTRLNIVASPSVQVAVSPSTFIPSRNTAVTFTATPTNGGSYPRYQWKLNGVNVGTNNSVYVNNNWSEGNIVTCLLSSNLACPFPDPGYSDQTIHLLPKDTITALSPCSGSLITLSGTPPADRVIWSLNGTPIDTVWASWNANATTVAGGNGQGSALNQLSNPSKVIVDEKGNIFIGDEWNHRVLRYAPGAISGVVVAGGNGAGFGANQFNFVWGVSTNGNGDVYVADESNTRVQKWAAGATTGVTVAGGKGAGVASNQLSGTYGLFVDSVGNVYVIDALNFRVQKWAPGVDSGITVAGGNGSGSAANQLANPTDIFVDRAGNIYVTDPANRRVQKWAAGAASGVTVAGGNGNGSALNQLGVFEGIAVDGMDNIYVADGGNNRIVRWKAGATSGELVAGGNGSGSAANQFDYCKTIALDTAGNLYVSDRNNHRIQKFSTNTILTHATPSAGSYTALVTTFAGATKATSPIVINPSITPSVSITASPSGAICAGTSVTFTAVGIDTGTAPTYQWRKNGLNVIGSGNTFTSSSLANGDVISVRLSSSAPCAMPDTVNSAAITETVNPTPAITASSFVNPTTCAGTNGTITIYGLTGATTYIVNFDKGGVPQGPLSRTTTGSGSITLTGLGSGSYTNFTATLGSCTSAVYPGPITLSPPASPVITSVTKTNPTSCGGTNGTMTLNGLVASTSYAITYFDGISTTSLTQSSNGTGSIVLTGIAAGTYSNFAVTLVGCTGTFAGPVTLSPPSAPAISSVTKTDPTSCGGTDGTLSINGLNASTSYAITYFDGTSTTSLTQSSNGAGSIVLTGITAGTYSNFAVTLAGCTGTFAGPVTLSPPSAPAISSVTKTDPTSCGGTDGTLSINGLNASTSYAITYFDGTSTTSLTQSSNGTGSIVLTGITAGTYSNFAVTLVGCTGTFAGPVTLNPPASPNISSASKTDPTTCGGTDGTITLNGLNASSIYTISYFNGATTITLTGQLSNGSGTVMLTGLAAGTYSAITASRLGCSGSYVGALTLNPPATPAAPTAGNNGPICSGTTLNLTATSPLTGTYSWTGPNTYTASSQNTSITNAQTADAGTYNVTITVAGCTSLPASTTAVINPTPVITSVTGNSPTTCGGGNATISVNGLSPSANYTINFSKGAIGQTPFIGTANAGGSVIITGLSTGTYTAFTATLGTCTSASIGNVTITNPAPPPTPIVSSNSTRCAGDTLKLFTPVSSGVSYAWSGPNSFTSASQNPIIVNAQTNATGTYVLNVTSTTTGCTSANATLNAVVYPLPIITTSSSTNPTACNSATGTITLNGLSASTSFAINYLKNTVAQTATITSSSTGSILITGLTAGTYTNITASSNGCPSNAVASFALSDPPLPPAPSASSNSPVCQTATLNLSVTGLPGATFNWTGPNSFTSTSATPSITNMQAVNAGTYYVTQTISACVSPAANTLVVMSTPPPTPGAISGNATPCANSSYTYSINPVSTATSYSWTIPSGWTGTSTNNSITVTTNGSGGTISVKANNICGSSASSSLGTSILTIPPKPGTITGFSSLCNGTYTSYAIDTVVRATSYTWTVPTGWTGYNYVNNLTVTAGANSGNITVTADNACGSSAAQILAVTVLSIPMQPGSISGNTSPCINSAQTYATSAVSGATSYVWTYPISWTGGSTSTTANFNVGAGSGNVTVSATNICGTSTARSLAVTVIPLPIQPAAITGPTAPCANSNVRYSTSTASGTSSYTWQYPSGWSGTGTSNTTNVLVDTAAGNITVTGVNGCGSGPSRTLTVTATPVQKPTASVIPTSISICQGAIDTFNASITYGGTSPIYQWKKNGLNVGTNANNYVDPALKDGDSITVSLTSSLPCVNAPFVQSVAFVIKVNPTVVPGININTTPPNTLCAGTPFTFKSNDTGAGASPTYQWYKNGNPITGATSITYTDPALANKDTLVVVMQSSALCAAPRAATSNKMGVTVRPTVTPTVSITANPAGPYPVLVPVTFTATENGGGATPTYQWMRNGVPIPFATGTSYVANAYNNGDEYGVEMQSYDPCATKPVANSNTIVMVLGPTGINSFGTWQGNISLFPNPNDGHFTVSATWPTQYLGKRVAIDIINVLGQSVYHTELRPTTTLWSHDVWLRESLASGHYLLRLNGEGMSGVLRFVVGR